MSSGAAGRLDGEKKSLIASEQDATARAVWRAAMADVPRNPTRNTTLIAALTRAGLDAPMVIEGAMDREAFVAWLTHFLVPMLAPGRGVVRDNLSVHKGRQVRQIIEQAECTLVGHPLGSIPAYSPDYSPIEGAYSKVKTLVRRAGKRTQGEREGAIGRAVEVVTSHDAAGWLRHCGYHPAGQYV